MFSPGNMVVNTISNHKYIKNIYMGEDGIMPYFNQKYYYKNYNLNTSYYKQILIKVFYNFTRFDLKRRLKQILILAPKYYIKDTDENIIIKEANYSNDIMKNCFNDLSKTFNYKNDITYKDAQILYFDSDLSRLGYISAKDEVKIIASVLSIFKDNKIVIKPHQHIDNEKLALLRELVVNNNNINIDEQNYEIPWEIIYFNNMDSLKRSINLTFLSSIIISSDVLFNKINKNILLHKIIVNEKINHAQVQDKIHLFINKIKSIHNNDKKNLLEPLNLLELKNNFHKKHLL